MLDYNQLREEAQNLTYDEMLDELRRPTGNWNKDVMRECLLRLLINKNGK